MATSATIPQNLAGEYASQYFNLPPDLWNPIYDNSEEIKRFKAMGKRQLCSSSSCLLLSKDFSHMLTLRTGDLKP